MTNRYHKLAFYEDLENRLDDAVHLLVKTKELIIKTAAIIHEGKPRWAMSNLEHELFTHKKLLDKKIGEYLQPLDLEPEESEYEPPETNDSF